MRERDKKRGKIRFYYHGSHVTGTCGCGEDKVMVRLRFWTARLSAEFLAARAPCAHSLSVSAGYVSQYQKINIRCYDKSFF
jgi:hypothetical protein